MDEKALALRHAQELDRRGLLEEADKLRRLHAVNAELLEALKSTHALLQATLFIVSGAEARAIARQQLDVNRAVIAKAEEPK